MSAQTTSVALEANSRDVTGKKVRQLRLQGQIPAVVYGHKQKSHPLVLDEKSFLQVYREAGNATLVDLTVDGQKSHKVIIHSVQLHPSRNSVLHVDLYQVNMKEKLRTEVPLEQIGTAPVVEIDGGTLITVKDEIEIECLPEDLIPHLEIDISNLKTFEDVVRVSDLVVPAGITILLEPEEMLISVLEPRSQEELDALDTVDTTDETAVESETVSGTDQEAPAEGGEQPAEAQEEK
ncbi:50S ribosomal protein L25 [Patescibacteria group bacterium]|nr:50S ribosomal protein L25 [Patescibacteria group bacterium]